MPLSQVDHLVVLMMENRSFDHMLGYLRADGGRRDVDALTGREANTHEGVRYPVTRFGANDTVFADDPDHSTPGTADQMSGDMGGFVRSFARAHPDAPRGRIMGYHGADHVEMFDLIAREFTICDRWYCSHPGPTQPNRLYQLTGGCGGRTENVALVPPPFRDRTIFEVLDEHGVDWRYYGHDLAFLRAFPRYALDTRRVRNANDPVRGLYVTAESGNLPPVTFIDPDFLNVPPFSSDDHPPSDILAGQRLIRRIYRSLTRSPQWPRLLFVITYDEHGGFYDHVVPPAAAGPPGFQRFGPRVPALVVSPLVARGAVCHDVFDHTSILKTILNRWCNRAGHIPDLGPRVAAARDLSSLLIAAPADPPDPPRPPIIRDPPPRDPIPLRAHPADSFHEQLRALDAFLRA